MNSLILVTGGTGNLGSVIVQRLRDRGTPVRVLSRRAGAGTAVGDLSTGAGIADAVAGVSAIVHCATGKDDARATRTLIDAARATGSPHIVYISIVGIDRIPLGYYKAKLAAERLIESSGLPFTILRATQFHTLVAGLFSAQRRLPAIFAPSFSFQPIDVADVADRLVELATADAAGRVPDIGGPQVRTAHELATSWLATKGLKRAVWPLRLPGATFRALREGNNLVPQNPAGVVTFEEFLARP